MWTSLIGLRQENQLKIKRWRKMDKLLAFNIEVDIPKTATYPDFCDAFIISAEHFDGTPFNDDELDNLNENHPDIIYEAVMKQFF